MPMAHWRQLIIGIDTSGGPCLLPSALHIFYDYVPMCMNGLRVMNNADDHDDYNKTFMGVHGSEIAYCCL